MKHLLLIIACITLSTHALQRIHFSKAWEISIEKDQKKARIYAKSKKKAFKKFNKANRHIKDITPPQVIHEPTWNSHKKNSSPVNNIHANDKAIATVTALNQLRHEHREAPINNNHEHVN
jgi:hypothetical protein